MLGVELEGVGKDCDLNRGVKDEESKTRIGCFVPDLEECGSWIRLVSSFIVC